MPDESGELVPADLAAFTQERLDEGDPATATALSAALRAVRSYCGWHVTPVRTAQVVTIDGPCSRLLVLPTLRLTALTALVEDGVTVDVGALEWSSRGLVRKAGRGWWTGRFGGITATMSHGFDSAEDWQAAVLSFADRSSLALAGVDGRPNVVGPFQWPSAALADGSAFSVAERSLLDLYRLESSP